MRKWVVGMGKWEVGMGKWEVGMGKWECGMRNAEKIRGENGIPNLTLRGLEG